LTAITATVGPLLTVPQPKAFYTTAGPGALMDDARELTRRAGYDTANYDLDIVAFTAVPGWTFGGLGAVHGKAIWLQGWGAGVTAHEMGHNYGLWHANFWDASLNNSIIASGTNIEYGNIYDNMGSAGLSQFNAIHKNTLDWLPDSAVHNVTSNGVYRVYPFEAPQRLAGVCYAAKTSKDFERNYWVEYRASFPDNPWLQNGLLLNWSPWASSKGGTDLLDTTPGTAAPSTTRLPAFILLPSSAATMAPTSGLMSSSTWASFRAICRPWSKWRLTSPTPRPGRWCIFTRPLPI
jgi:hypothetical protein